MMSATVMRVSLREMSLPAVGTEDDGIFWMTVAAAIVEEALVGRQMTLAV